MASNDKRIFGIGTTGLVGSRVAELLADTYPISHYSSKTGFDITDPASLTPLLTDTEHTTVLLMAAKADVDGCEKDKPLREDGTAWKIHVAGTEYVVEACKKTEKKIIYISTDFVFSGDDTPEDGYIETDIPFPINWYGQTKYEGEKIVVASGLPYLVLRIAYPFRKSYPGKKDFVRAILAKLASGQPVKAITDHVMTPTYIDDIASAIQRLMEKRATGTFHVVGSEYISPFDAAIQIATTMQYETALVQPITREDFFRDRAQRPFDLSIKNAKIKRLGVAMRDFTDGLQEFTDTS